MAAQEVDTVLLLELPYRKAQRRLRDVELLGRAGDVPELDDAHEILQLA
jgi:hypothetical protein